MVTRATKQVLARFSVYSGVTTFTEDENLNVVGIHKLLPQSAWSKSLLPPTHPCTRARGPSLFEMSSIDAEIYLKFEIYRNFFEIQ